MCNEKSTGTWLPVVKKTVDAIYDYLIQHPDGITMSAAEYGKRGARVCTRLVSRGIVEKRFLGRGNGWRYKWAATMAPTKVLYGSIAQELYDEDRAFYMRKSDKKKREKATVEITPLEEEKPVTPITVIQAIDAFTDQELWDELKSRGYSIEDNRLVVTRKVYLD